MNESTSLFFCPPVLSKLHALGMTREEINQRVKDKAFTESESIYGTLYGTLGEDMDEDVSYVVCDCGGGVGDVRVYSPLYGALGEDMDEDV